MGQESYSESVQRRPEYLEELEKALLAGIFGQKATEDVTDEEGNIIAKAGDLYGGLLQSPLMSGEQTIPEYYFANQMGRGTIYGYDENNNPIYDNPETEQVETQFDITGMGLETFPVQALMQDSDGDNIPDFLGRYQPYMDTAGGAITGGLESMFRGMETLGQAKDFYAPAVNMVSGGRGMYDPRANVADFMNPYTENVLREVERDIDRQGAQSMNRANAQAVKAGAFGGSRQGVQAAEIERSIMDAKAKASSDLRAKSYDQALAGSMGAYKDAMTRELEAGRLMGGLGQSVGQIGSQYGQMGNIYGGLGGTSADIGRVTAALAPADMAFMMGVGEKERGYRQNYLDNFRREQMRPMEQAMMPYNYAYGVLSGTPSASMYGTYDTQYGQDPNAFTSAVGAYTTLAGVNQAGS